MFYLAQQAGFFAPSHGQAVQAGHAATAVLFFISLPQPITVAGFTAKLLAPPHSTLLDTTLCLGRHGSSSRMLGRSAYFFQAADVA